jgi:hypothetical protein
MNSVMMCRILIIILFRSYKSNFEYLDMDTNTDKYTY